MTPTIEVDEEIFELLKRNAEVFVDTPNTVLRRLLGLDANGHHAAPEAPANASKPAAAEAPATTAGKRSERSSRLRARAAAGSAKKTRAARGSLLPEAEYELPILRYLDGHGGRAPSREVIESIGEELADRLTETDKQQLNSGDVRWKSRAAFVRLRLVERGDLNGQAPRGTWEITDQGRQRVGAEQ